MTNTKFKALMHSGHYVNANFLHKGIYTTLVPHIYDNATTIDKLVQNALLVKDMNSDKLVSDSYIVNLKQCVLVDITITI